MNGKKAKLNRKLAGVNSKQPGTGYAVLDATLWEQNNRRPNGTRRLRTRYHPTALNDSGLPMVIGQFETHTLVLHKCSRQLYKIIKKTYTDFQRGSRAIMHASGHA